MGIQVCEQPGRCTNILNKPEFTATPISNIAFGGPDRNWLYVTQGSKIFRRQTKRTGGRVGNDQTAATRIMIATNHVLKISSRCSRWPLALAGGDSLMACGSRPGKAKTVADGVYTDAQAARGGRVYAAACAGCHRADLGGGQGPALKDQRFARGLR